MDPLIDLRSDTVTKPTAAMRKAMAEAEVGDDVLGEDPTIKRLEERTAELLAKEAALFAPTGTMANQLAIGVHTRPGDELLCDPTSHVYVWEGGGIARLWGVTTRTVSPAGKLLDAADFQGLIRPDDCHYVRTRLVTLENTQNRRGGAVHAQAAVERIGTWTHSHNLGFHCDGARFMNAAVALGMPAAKLAAPFDTVSLCFSKGLGAPVGSAIAGSKEFIAQAHRLRKVLGGGMRQAGIIAAGALYALEHHVQRLAEDHEHARIIAQAVAETPGLKLEHGTPDTNLIWIEVEPKLGTAAEVAGRLRAQGILVSALGPQIIRACTHLDLNRSQVERVAQAVRALRHN